MEYLDTYDENGKFIGKKPRDIVHKEGFWHNTVHCWLYDKEGNVYFQIREDQKTFYTTASGHVAAGETIKEAFVREIKEEIGLELDIEKAECIEILPFKMDRENKDGTIFKDRALANVYIYEFNGTYKEFDFDLNEVDGVVKVNAKEALSLFEKEEGMIKAEIITVKDNQNVSEIKDVLFEEFLVNKNETAIEKYGFIMKKIIEATSSIKK